MQHTANDFKSPQQNIPEIPCEIIDKLKRYTILRYRSSVSNIFKNSQQCLEFVYTYDIHFIYNSQKKKNPHYYRLYWNIS